MRDSYSAIYVCALWSRQELLQQTPNILQSEFSVVPSVWITPFYLDWYT